MESGEAPSTKVARSDADQHESRWSLSSAINGHDRAAIFTDSASTATTAGPAYWLVLALAGAIAALGLALDSSAVIIGAMLIAPLLAPVIGLGLALAVGDGRLAVEVAFIVLLSTITVVAVAALLALALPLPFQTVTTAIAARTRPTTLDLVIAVFSGLAGAVVTVAPRSRLSGAVPGVAVAVALVPPLAVTGYGIGTGWNWPIIRGSLLLYGANLAGIVMSGMTVFLVVGMHGAGVLGVVAAWHEERAANPLTNWIERIPGLRALGIMRSPWARVMLVAAFVAAVGIPLRESLRQIARESRIRRAIDDAAHLFENAGQSFIVNRSVDIGHERTSVVLNVATTSWFGDSTERLFERRASRAARETVSLVLNQVPASSGDLSQLAALLSDGTPKAPPVAAAPQTPAARVAAMRAALSDAIAQLDLPDSVAVVAHELSIGDTTSATVVTLLYAAPRPLTPQATQMVQRRLARVLGPQLELRMDAISTSARSLRPRQPAVIDSLAALVRRYPALRLEVAAGSRVRQRDIDSIVARFRRAGALADSSALRLVHAGSGTGLSARVVVRAPDDG